MADVDPGRPPAEWELGAGSRAQAAELATRPGLVGVAGVASSPEPKARATAEVFADRLGVPLRVDGRLAEVRRPWVGEGYRLAAHRYLAGDEPDGWEARSEVAARMAAAVDDLRTSAGDGEALVVGHGLALAIHLEQVLAGRFDPYGFWCRLAFPDAWRVDRDERTLARLITRP